MSTDLLGSAQFDTTQGSKSFSSLSYSDLQMHLSQQ